jgi:putative permease
MRATLSLPFYVRLALVLGILIAVGYLAILGKTLLSPLLFALLFALLLVPLASIMEKKLHFPRGAGAITSVLVYLTVLLLVVFLIGSQTSNLAQALPLLKSQLTLSFYSIELWALEHLHIDPQKQATMVRNATDNLVSQGSAVVSETVVSLSTTLLFWVFTLIYTFFILLYRRLLTRFVMVAFNERFAPIIATIISEVKPIIFSYITALATEMAIVAVVAIFLLYLIGVQYFILLGLIVGIFNLIPYLGIFTALLISCAVTFATMDARHALYVAVSIICIHLIDSNYLMPKIVGSKVRLNPLIVVIGVVLGELIWGIPGMFLAIPYLAIAKVVFDRVDGLQAWGLLLGQEEQTPTKIRPLQRWMKKKTDTSPKKSNS